MTDMPQMVAIYNGMGGGAAALIAAVEFLRAERDGDRASPCSACIGALIGSVSFSGSMIAFAKLQGLIKKSFLFPGQNVAQHAGAGRGPCALAVLVALQHTGTWAAPTASSSASSSPWRWLYGVLMTLPIGGADMPVVISLYNALTGLAVGFEGYVLGNAALIIAGVVVGSAGTLLTQLMAKAMNRSLANVLFAGFGADGGRGARGRRGLHEGDGPGRRRHHHGLRPEGHHRARLRHGRGAGAAQGLGAGAAAAGARACR